MEVEPCDERFELGQFFNTNSFDNKPSLKQQMRTSRQRPGSQQAVPRPRSQVSQRQTSTPQRPITSSNDRFVDLLGVSRKDKYRAEITGPIGHMDRRDPGSINAGVKSVDHIGTYKADRLNRCGLRPPWRCAHQPHRGTWVRSANGSLYLQGSTKAPRTRQEDDLCTESAPSWTSPAMATWRGGLKSWGEEDLCSTYMHDISHQSRRQMRCQKEISTYRRSATPSGPPDTPLRYRDSMLGTVLDNTTTKTNLLPAVLQVPRTNRDDS